MTKSNLSGQTNQKTIIGIDYSLNSPAICIADNSFDFKKCSFHFLTSKKKHIGKFGNNVFGYEHREYNTPIEHLGFGVRLLNILRSGRIETFGDLCKSTPTELFKLRGFGKKNLKEMKEFLDSKGIKWGEIK